MMLFRTPPYGDRGLRDMEGLRYIGVLDGGKDSLVGVENPHAPEATTVEPLFADAWPVVHVSENAHAKMWALICACDCEVSWLSPCTRQANGDILVEDVYVPIQECSKITTRITKEGDHQLLQELMQQGAADVINRMRCWGHSHVDMDVFASGEDEAQTRRYAKRYDDYFLRLIANRRGELFCSLYLIGNGVGVHNPVVVDHVPKHRHDKWQAWAKREISTKVTRVPDPDLCMDEEPL